MKQLYHVAIDPEYQDHNPDHHDRDHIYLVWLDDDDLAQMVERTGGRVSWWETGVCELLDDFIVSWRERQELDDR